MKKLFSYLPFVLMVLCGGVLASCSDDDDSAPEVVVSAIVGVWSETYQSEGVSLITTFTFNPDGSGQMVKRVVSGGQALTADPVGFSYTYNESTEIIRLKFENEDVLYNGDASITGNTLVLRYNNTYYSLTKQ